MAMRLADGVIVVSAVLLSACGRESPKLVQASAADSAAVAQVVATFDSCARAGALDVFLSYIADDAVVLAPDQPALVGKQAIRDFYRSLYGSLTIEGRHEPIETHSIGDLVVSRGEVRATATPQAGGQAITVNSKYLMLLRRQAGGSLQLWRAAFNPNTPPGPPPAAAPRR
jgi:ketosteroid isomerase-like protein